MSGFNFKRFVDITSVVQKPAFTTEKQHALLLMDNEYIPSETPFLELSGINDFTALFGTQDKNYNFVKKYFNFLSKTGTNVQKLIVARWYREAAAAFVTGADKPASLAEIKAYGSGTFTISMNGIVGEHSINLANVTSYSDVASLIQTTLRANTSGGAAFTASTVYFDSTSGKFFIINGSIGNQSTIDSLTCDDNLLELLGGKNLIFSQGANAETYADCLNRLYLANNAGFSYVTNEILTDEEITDAIDWTQGHCNELRLIFSGSDKDDLIALSNSLRELSYTGYVLIYDPNNENVNALDCALAASIDYGVINGAINYNFQNAVGFTPVTNLGSVSDYQAGLNNESLGNELDNAKISYVYSVGVGTNQKVLYGLGLMAGMYGLESTHSNECWLVKALQIAIMNGFINLPKINLRGSVGQNVMSSLINPVFTTAINNGTMSAGTLSELDKVNIINATGNTSAPDCVENNGYYYQIEELNEEDIALQRIRILVCYLSAGVINKVRIINNIYGA
ncbi:MAG: DUF3383 domain-containing protein [Rickettsiales bacterium]|jgi:hypothetical protein|nr:DUF3383 domain-containing protein [Rickettsiales bacterium]